MALTDTTCRREKSADCPRRLFDAHGLYLEVMSTGAKYWRLKYRFNEKEKRLALGVYPDVSLLVARKLCESARSATHGHRSGYRQARAEGTGEAQ